VLRPDIESFPRPHAYLMPDSQERQRWRDAFAGASGGPAIGLSWRSGKSGGHRAVQYAPLSAWADFIRGLPGTLISAQYDSNAEEIAELESRSGRKLIVPPRLDQKNELDRTCAMLAALDMLVSAPTAVSWLGAATGTPVLKILYDTSWTALAQPYEPFAPSCTCVMP